MIRAVGLQQLLPGDQLPTVKQLAMELVVNPNTVAKAYRDLEREGIIETFPGRGSFVASGKVVSVRDEQMTKLTAEMRKLVSDANALGIAAGELIRQFEKEVQECYRREDDAVGNRNRKSD